MANVRTIVLEKKTESYSESRDDTGETDLGATPSESTPSTTTEEPTAAEPLVDFFPLPVLYGLVVGAIAGSLFGLLVAAVLHANLILLPNWDRLFPLGYLTFYLFWLAVGCAIGTLSIGVGAILLDNKQKELTDE